MPNANRHFFAGLAALCLVLVSDASRAAEGPLVVFASGPQGEWQSFAGDKKNWALEVRSDMKTLNETVTVAVLDDGAHRVTWKGRAEGQYFLAGAPQDLSALIEDDAGLVVVLQIHRPPSRDVSLRMGCGYPCAANANITRLLKALPKDEWVRFSVAAQCFADNGLWSGNVDMPFMLHTRGRMDVSIGEVRIEPGAGADAIIRC